MNENSVHVYTNYYNTDKGSWMKIVNKVDLRLFEIDNDFSLYDVVQTGDIGQVACIPSDFHGAGCHALIILRTDSAVMKGLFLDAVLRSKYGFDCLKSHGHIC